MENLIVSQGQSIFKIWCHNSKQNLLHAFYSKFDEPFCGWDTALEEHSDQSQTTGENSEIGSIEDKESPRTNENSDFLKSWAVESLPDILKFLKLDCVEKLPVQKEIMKFMAVQGLFTASLGMKWLHLSWSRNLGGQNLPQEMLFARRVLNGCSSSWSSSAPYATFL